MNARTIGQETFEAFQRRRYRHPAFRTDWEHPSVGKSRPAWEAAGQKAVEAGAGPALAALIDQLAESRDLLARVRLILANGELSEAEGRTPALEVIQQSESREEASA